MSMTSFARPTLARRMPGTHLLPALHSEASVTGRDRVVRRVKPALRDAEAERVALVGFFNGFDRAAAAVRKLSKAIYTKKAEKS